jgi:monoterpene epsilon-lactone hydrolase
MSIQNILVKAFLRLTNYKKRQEKRSFEDKQTENLPQPPAALAAKFSCETVAVDGAKAVWLNKENSRSGALVYLHGGSYNAGAFNQQWEYLAEMCEKTGMAALLIDYRLAPQDPFPAGLDDALNILETLSAIGDLPAKWFLLGDSAGAGLAVAVFYELREAELSLPEKMILMSGWFDLSIESPEIRQNPAIDPMLSLERMILSAKVYIGGDTAKNPLISPIFGDLQRFPPVLIQCGTADLLIWENRRFYQKCRDAGVAVIYEEYPKLFHDFMMIGFVPEARTARNSQIEFLCSSNI